MQLVVEEPVVSEGDPVVFRLVNRGHLNVLTGLTYRVQRWTGQKWMTVPWPENTAFPDVGIVLPPAP